VVVRNDHGAFSEGREARDRLVDGWRACDHGLGDAGEPLHNGRYRLGGQDQGAERLDDRSLLDARRPDLDDGRGPGRHPVVSMSTVTNEPVARGVGASIWFLCGGYVTNILPRGAAP